MTGDRQFIFSCHTPQRSMTPRSDRMALFYRFETRYFFRIGLLTMRTSKSFFEVVSRKLTDLRRLWTTGGLISWFLSSKMIFDLS